MTASIEWAPHGPWHAYDRDEDAHVEAKRVFDLKVAMLLCVTFSDLAARDCRAAERRLDAARARRARSASALHRVDRDDVHALREARATCDEDHAHVVDATIEAARALAYLMRTTATLESAIRLCSMGRT